jgi:iron complex transport system substrate-binding protein
VKKQLLLFMLAVLLLFTLTACNPNQENKTSNEESVDTSNSKDGTKYPITLTDASGTKVTFKKVPKRIVSIAPAETEVLFALGLGEQVVGVTDWCDYPAKAQEKAKVGDMTSNLEAILALKPDVIFGGYTLNKGAVNKLRELGKTVFTVEPKTIEQAMDRIEQVGLITNRQKEAESVVKVMKSEMQQVVDAVASIKPADQKSVYIEFDPLWTVGKGEFGHDMISLANANNIAADKVGWIEVNDEFVINQNPDVILYSNYAPASNARGEAIKKRSGWSNISAVKNNLVISIDANLLSRPGPRITKGLLEVARGVYPELVK